jgi:hypothetical protein
MLIRIARAGAKARVHAWELNAAAGPGFPWLGAAGKLQESWVVIDKEGTAPTWEKGFGFHPLGPGAGIRASALPMLLRRGNAGSNTFTNRKAVSAAAVRQVLELCMHSALRLRCLQLPGVRSSADELLITMLATGPTWPNGFSRDGD